MSPSRPILAVLIVFALASLFMAVSAVALSDSAWADLFDEEKEAEAARNEAGEQIEATTKAIEAIQMYQLFITLLQMQQGDCSPAIEIEGKAKTGHAESQWMLADLHRTGLCVQMSKEKTASWLGKAAEQGHSKAAYELGYIFLKGEGVTRSPRRAERLLQGAAEKGDDRAARLLARMHHDGDGIPQNTKVAVTWYERAIALGSQMAAVDLALMYLQGEVSGRPDADAAIRYARSAADKGEAFAQIIAALALQTKPNRTRRDLIEAHKWANLATAAEKQEIVDQAQTIRADLENVLTSAEVLRAQQEAASWKPGSLTPPLPTRKPRPIPRVNIALADGLTQDQARAKLRELGIPITRQSFRKAIQTDNLGVVKLFQKAGADLDAPLGVANMVPIYVAADYESRETFDYLLAQGVNVNIRSETGMTALVRAIGHDQRYMIDRLLQAGATASQDPKYRPETTGSLFGGNSALLYAVMGNDAPLVRRLFNHGASVNERYFNDETPLMKAVRESPTIIELLLAHGADPNAIDQYGQTALHHALDEPLDAAVVRALLEGGADPSGGSHAIPPLYAAVFYGDSVVTGLLIDHGAQPDQRFRFAPEHIPIMTPKDLRPLVMSGGTSLMVAAHLGHASVAKALITRGADRGATVNIDGEDLTAAEIAQRQENVLVNQILQ